MFYIAGIEIIELFCSRDLDLDPMTFMYELDPYSLEIYRMYKYDPTLTLWKVIVRQTAGQTNKQTDRQTHTQKRPKLYATPLRGWSTMLLSARLINTCSASVYTYTLLVPVIMGRE